MKVPPLLIIQKGGVHIKERLFMF